MKSVKNTFNPTLYMNPKKSINDNDIKLEIKLINSLLFSP